MGNARIADILKLLASILVCQLAGFIGSLVTTPAISTWYVTLEKPWFTPPNWVFAPAWITLYTLMGISLFLVWQKGVHLPSVKQALSVFAIQLVLNALWSAMFFGLRSPMAGLITINILWIAILVTIVLFLKVSRTAGFLLIPYILWVSFATILNFSIVLLNI